LRDSLEKLSARRKASALDNKTYTGKAKTSMTEAGFEPAISKTKRPIPSSQTARLLEPRKQDMYGL
jgi:hypothetical protein